MPSNSRFARGSGLFACRICKRSTRSTGRGDNEHIRLCVECYDLAGIDNAFRDGNGRPSDLDIARSALNRCIAKGGKVSRADFDAIPFDGGYTVDRERDADETRYAPS